MPEHDLLPVAASRARRASYLLAAAHLVDIPIPRSMWVSNDDETYVADLAFHASPDEFDAWSKWLEAKTLRVNEHGGERWTTAVAESPTTQEWGPVTVQFTKSEPIG